MNKVLIVDDHADIRQLLAIMLGKDFALLQAEDGATALDLIWREQPKAVLLDVMMPGEPDGMKVLQTIKSDPATRHILVAMVTARGQQVDQAQAKRLGADAYFVKPFSPLQVLNWLREHCR